MWLASVFRSRVKQKIKHVYGQLEKMGKLRDRANCEPSLHDGEHGQLFIGGCYRRRGKTHKKGNQ